jgi:hypothetical protein
MSLQSLETAPQRRVETLDREAEKILDHVVEAIAAAKACDEPFGHCHVTKVFPDDVYARMQNSFPDPQYYHPLNPKAWSNSEGISTRDRMFLSEDALEKLPAGGREFWTTIAHVVTSNRLKRAIYAKLWKDIALRFNVSEEEVPDLDGYPRAVLFRDTAEYRIKPHPDGETRVVTMMYYLPKDMSQEDLGTSLYERAPFYKRLVGGSKFREVKRFPYVPNSAAAFVVNRLPTRTSWHGREYIQHGYEVRNSILTQFREDYDGHDY